VPIKKELLEILCCPMTKKPVAMLPGDKLARLNEMVRKGVIKNADGSAVKEPLQEALITSDGKTIYRIDGDIPVMLADLGIPTDQIENF
jgi:uncharacterized protein YbaR (Trm112 family)